MHRLALFAPILSIATLLVGAPTSEARELPLASRAEARSPHRAPPAKGDTAPDFRLLDQHDRVVRLSQTRGKKAVLVFYRGYW